MASCSKSSPARRLAMAVVIRAADDADAVDADAADAAPRRTRGDRDRSKIAGER